MAAIPTTAPAPVARPAAGNGFLGEVGDLVIFAGESLAALPGTLRFASEALRQASMMLVGTLGLMFIMNVFQGMSVANAGYFLLRSIGASDYLGLLSGYVGPRQLATCMFGYVFTAKICCGMAAELGAMRIQQEVDAYEATGVDPRKYLVGTRLWGVILFIPIATIVAVLGNMAGTYFDAVVLLNGVPGHVLIDVHWSVQTLFDYFFALLTIGTIAILTAIVACFYGLRTRGGPDAVGRSVARSMLVNIVILHIIAASFAVVIYGTDLRLPIGG
ncbi:MAG TPA: ABC transporter permease [Baekduia sp.]|nr:ABC transporter permease [Baekduia sp.]